MRLILLAGALFVRHSTNLIRTHSIIMYISGLKPRVLKLTFFAKNDGEKWSRILYFEIHPAPSEIPANLPGQFSLFGQIFLHWAAGTLKGLGEIQNNFS